MKNLIVKIGNDTNFTRTYQRIDFLFIELFITACSRTGLPDSVQLIHMICARLHMIQFRIYLRGDYSASLALWSSIWSIKSLTNCRFRGQVLNSQDSRSRFLDVGRSLLDPVHADI